MLPGQGWWTIIGQPLGAATGVGRVGTWVAGRTAPSGGRRRTTVNESISIQHWMVLALLFFMDVAVLGCLFLIAMNRIYLLP